MGLFGDVEGAVSMGYTIALWPAVLAGSLGSSGDMVAGIAGGAAGLGTSYYVFGNPMPAIESLDWKPLVGMYVTTGVVFWLTSSVVDKFTSKTAW